MAWRLTAVGSPIHYSPLQLGDQPLLERANKAMLPDQTLAAPDNLGPPLKRQKKDDPLYTGLPSLDREISPPSLGGRSSSDAAHSTSATVISGGIFAKTRSSGEKSTRGRGQKNCSTGPCVLIDLVGEETGMAPPRVNPKQKLSESRPASPQGNSTNALPSPFQLTSIRDLPASENVDTIGIKDILGDVMIKEAWIFNYLVDLDWVMTKFDPDIRDTVHVKIVHGSWRKEDSNRARLEEQGKHYPNVKIICAYMPEPFGTHHSKMIVLFRHDDFAQIIIHTSNMIAFDWKNMTQAAWRSPLLPLNPTHNESSISVTTTGSKNVGEAFKNAILLYFAKYDKSRTGTLVEQLKQYSFHDVRAVFIGSVPGKFQVDGRSKGDMWGWMALKRIMGNIPAQHNNLQVQNEGNPGGIVVQVSSIATLGQTNIWLSPVLYKALSASRNTEGSSTASKPKRPKLSIIFPTAEEVRDSLNGYNSGAAIHIKIQSKTQQKQLSYLKPFLCHWNSSPPTIAPNQQSPPSQVYSSSGRSRAAPHIKTYIRFADEACTKIDWAMLTSANLSTQAWGTSLGNPSGGLMGHGEGEVRICSYEAGVVVYPELFEDCEGGEVEMVPVFRKDTPDMDEVGRKKVVGLRMPYGLPIKSYGKNDLPWCATMSYGEEDWKGQSWEGD